MLGFLIYTMFVPVVMFVIARLLNRRYGVHGRLWLLVLACLMFALAIFYPSPRIHGEDTQFMTHLVGGGMVVGLLWLYFMPLMQGVRWYWRAVILYAAVSALGVLNELYELFAHETGLITQPITDTSWDLLANTLGALIVMLGYYLFTFLCDRRKK